MFEYQDGTFSDIMSQEKAAKKLMDSLIPESAKHKPETKPIRSLHFGTEEELQECREKRTLEERMDELERKLEAQEKPSSSLLHLPTAAERMAVLDNPLEIDDPF